MQINDEYHSNLPAFLTPIMMVQLQKDFNKFFTRHLLKNYCSIIREQVSKRTAICELIYTHCAHDLQMRIKVVKSLKGYLKDDEIVYCCHANLIACEEQFNE